MLKGRQLVNGRRLVKSTETGLSCEAGMPNPDHASHFFSTDGLLTVVNSGDVRMVDRLRTPFGHVVGDLGLGRGSVVVSVMGVSELHV